MPISSKTVRILAALSTIVLTPVPHALAASEPTGVWFNDTGRGAIEIKPCGSALCGHVVWVKDGSDAKGCGRQIIGDAAPVRGGTWDNGWIYSPERKQRYDVELKPLDDKRLRVVGYAGSKLFSKTMIWTRAPDDLARCDATTAKPAGTPAPASETVTAKAETKPAGPPAASGTAALLSAEARGYTARDKSEAAPAKTAPAPQAKQPETQPAPVETAEATPETDPADVPKEEAPGLGNLKLGDMKLDKYIKVKDGKCALDLPWVKLSFDCDK